MRLSSILKLIKMPKFKVLLSIILFIISKYFPFENIIKAISIILLIITILSINKKKLTFANTCLSIAVFILFIIDKKCESYFIALIITFENYLVHFMEKDTNKEKINLYQVMSVIVIFFLLIIFLVTKEKKLLLIISTILIADNYILLNLINTKFRKKIIKELNDKKIYVSDNIPLVKIARIRNIIFNKTGTLTSGKLRVTSVISDNIDELFYYLNNAEYNSNSIFKDAIYKYRKSRIDKNKIKNYQDVEGGISVVINKRKVLVGNYYLMKKNKIEVEKNVDQATVIYVSVDNKFMGSISISDSIKTKQKAPIVTLLKKNKIYLITGDNEKIANAVASEYKIRDKYSNSTSFEKKFWLTYLKSKTKGLFAIIDNNTPYSCDDSDIKIRINSQTKEVNDNDITISNDDLKNVIVLLDETRYYRSTIIINSIVAILIKTLSSFITIILELNILTMLIFEFINLIICILIMERGLIYEQYRNFKQL